MADHFLNLIVPRYQNNFYPRLLRKRVLGVITLAILGINLAASSLGAGVFAGDVESSALVTLTNAERTAAGLNSLRIDPRLVAAATAKANNMFSEQYWAHYGPNGETPWQFVTSSGYEYVYAGENLAKGFSSSEAVHSAWMASQTHRENIMNANYRDIGIAVVPGELQGTAVLLVVQMFGSQTSVPVSGTPAGNDTGIPPVSQIPQEVQAETVEIEHPSDGDLIAENTFLMNGAASDGVQSVDIDDNGAKTTGIISENGVWTYRPESSWKEGMHDVSVKDSASSASDRVTFDVDTVPPVVENTHVGVSGDPESGMVDIEVDVDDTADEVVFMLGDFSIALVKNDETGKYSTSVSEDELGQHEGSAKVVVSDKAGNFTETDLTEDVLGIVSSPVGHEPAANGVQIDTIARVSTRIAVIAIVILLIVDVTYLFRLNIVHTRGKTLFPMAIWLVLMGVGLAMGHGGSIL